MNVGFVDLHSWFSHYTIAAIAGTPDVFGFGAVCLGGPPATASGSKIAPVLRQSKGRMFAPKNVIIKTGYSDGKGIEPPRASRAFEYDD